MTEIDYEHECMRAELLGIDKPSREEFFSRKTENTETENDIENWPSVVAEELEHRGECLDKASGGLDELNNILSVTQKKINHLRTVCGSFTRILKLHSEANREDGSGSSNVAAEKVTELPPPVEDVQEECKGSESGTPIRKPIRNDIQSAVGSQLSKLDSLISKAERADLNLSSQNKQMKKFLK